MRIANKTLYETVKRDLNNISSEMLSANMVISSRKKINKLSDDPVGLVAVMDLRSSLSNIKQLRRNINTGNSWLKAGETALTQIEDILTQVKALSVEMASDSKGATERANAVEVVNGYLRQVMSLANTRTGGRYIFGGTETDTIPFTFDNETTPTTEIYSGNSNPFSIKIGKDIDLEVGRDGEAAFGAAGNSIFTTLIDLKTYLQGNNAGGIMGTLDSLDADLKNIRSLTSNTGMKIIRLDVKERIIDDLELTNTDRMSSLEDIDFAEAVIDLKSKELAYQASLASASKVMSISLVDYLK